VSQLSAGEAMKKPELKRGILRTLSALVAVGLAAHSAQALELGGLEISGYTRFGAFSQPSGTLRGNYSLGGDTQKFRLGNEGDAGLELGIGKVAELEGGKKLSFLYMPTVWDGRYGTAQVYVAASGFDFAPEARFWVGQSRLRLEEIYIVDSFVLNYGDHLGLGMTGLKLGFAKLGIGIFDSSTADRSNVSPNGAKRLNLDWSEIETNAGGSLRVLATLVSGQFQMGSPGAGLSLAHHQSNFLLGGLNNTLYLQGANGHAGLSGKFQGLGDGQNGSTQQPGVRGLRLADAIDWQHGAFGGQALAAIQTSQIEGGVNHGQKTRDLSLGGRVSYAFGEHFKLVAEVGSTAREVAGQASQRLNKYSVAPALALGPDFGARPELRFYLTRLDWNAAAATANAATFGANGRRSNTLLGMQLETKW
jgi:maltoporin